MPEPTNPNPAQAPQDGAAPGNEQVPQPTPPSKFGELKQKKGFKSEEELATAYEELERTKSRYESAHGKVKQQLESHGYAIEEDGTIKQAGQPQGPAYQQPQYQPQPGGYPPQAQADPIYDPYTGQAITDPLALQLARMPMGYREAFVVNAMLDQREKLGTASYQAEAETLSKPEAKGFEADVKNVMRQLPLQQRADKKAWEDALLRVKGMRYEQDLKNASQRGVESFINKDGIQVPAGSGGDGAGTGNLSPEQEQVYVYYQKNYPGMFKDKAEFLRSTRADGGRQ